VSIDYYTRLEQGKETNPSAEILDALTGNRISVYQAAPGTPDGDA
jgi:hypothetical protein